LYVLGTKLRSAKSVTLSAHRRPIGIGLETLSCILGKGGKVRQVLLPEVVSRSLLSLRGDAGANDPVFAKRNGGRLTERAVNKMVKAAAKRAGVNEAVSPHRLRHAHGSHAIERGASLPRVQQTLGHGNISTTSGYLHARPDDSSGLVLDMGVFLR
jgi:integrase/recombinase XerD